MKKWLVFIIFLIAFIFPSVAKANILINEISSGTTSDWVELFNNSTESASLTGYKITDSDGNKIDLSGNISGNGFSSFDFSNRLNNSGDSVNLFNGGNQIDSITYGGVGNVCLPQGTETIGRYPDGSNFIDRLSSSTRNLPNTWDSAHACPTPTPSLTPTPVPTDPPTPTQNPTPAPTRSPTPTPTVKVTPWPTKMPDMSTPADVLGIRTSLEATDPPSATPTPKSSGSSFPLVAGIFIFAGVGLMGGAGYLAFKKQKESSGTINE